MTHDASCPRVSGSARLSSSIRLPIQPAYFSSPLFQPLAQTLRPYIGPVLFDIVQTRGAVRFAVNHPPAGWNIGKDRPQAVLLLVVDQDKEAAIIVVKRIDAHRSPSHLVDMSETLETILDDNRVGPGIRQTFDVTIEAVR